jgi:hypothetical protein
MTRIAARQQGQRCAEKYVLLAVWMLSCNSWDSSWRMNKHNMKHGGGTVGTKQGWR